MPELPEVETVKNVLVRWVKDKKLENIKVLYKNIVDNCEESKLNEVLKGSTIVDVKRKGKFLIFEFDNDYILLSHLRMEGKYYYGYYQGDEEFENGIKYDLKSAKSDKSLKHVHVIFEFSDKKILMYHDTRKFGRMWLFKKDEYLLNKPLIDLGLEPFEMENGEVIYNFFKKNKKSIKEALLDQHIMAGLGNIYVDEVLFLSKIHPLTLANLISLDKCHEIVKNSVIVLNKAIALGGSTIKSYHAANDVDGKFQNELNVYGRDNEKCVECGTVIRKIFVGGRGTHFCPNCQKYHLNSNRVVGVTGLMGSGKSTLSKYLANNGYELLDADQIARIPYSSEQKEYQQIINLLGKDILNDDLSIDRNIVRSKVIKNEELKKGLEEIIHPFVKEYILERIKDKKKKFVLDVPLLFETNINDYCDVVVFVDCEDETRYERISLRNGMSVEEAKKLTVKMFNLNNKKKLSTFIVDNSLGLDELYQQANILLDMLNY